MEFMLAKSLRYVERDSILGKTGSISAAEVCLVMTRDWLRDYFCPPPTLPPWNPPTPTVETTHTMESASTGTMESTMENTHP